MKEGTNEGRKDGRKERTLVVNIGLEVLISRQTLPKGHLFPRLHDLGHLYLERKGGGKQKQEAKKEAKDGRKGRKVREGNKRKERKERKDKRQGRNTGRNTQRKECTKA
jgi:hypothetical protein